MEHFAGALPLWLAPTQVSVIPVSEKAAEYASIVVDVLRQTGIRASIDLRNERLQKKIRDAEVQKIPYMVVIGEKEESVGMVSVRSKAQRDIGRMKLGDFIERIKEETEKKVR